MTALAAPVMEHHTPVQPPRSPPLAYLLLSSLLVFLFPPLSRSWPRTGLGRPILIALIQHALRVGLVLPDPPGRL